jgi:predicted transcriptional regulator
MNEKVQFKYRDHRDILASILDSLYHDGSGVGVTYLIYTTVISWKGLLIHLDELLDKGLITSKVLPGIKRKCRRHHNVFFITEKGIAFLKLYKSLKEFLDQ